VGSMGGAWTAGGVPEVAATVSLAPEPSLWSLPVELARGAWGQIHVRVGK